MVPDGAVLLAEGREAEVYRLGDGRVLKLLRPEIDVERADREAAVCRMLADHGHRVPIVHETVSIEGRAGLVMDHIDGTDLLAALERRPLRVFTAARVLATVHAELHEHPAPRQLPDLRSELRERIAEAPLSTDLDRLALEVLDSLPSGDRICHGDLHLGNLLGTWAAPTVIDWAHASRGVPVADVARTELLHRVGTLPPGTSAAFRVLARVGRRLLADRYLALYRSRGTIDESLPKWRFVHAAARLSEPVPDEHPLLLDLLARWSPSVRA